MSVEKSFICLLLPYDQKFNKELRVIDVSVCRKLLTAEELERLRNGYCTFEHSVYTQRGGPAVGRNGQGGGSRVDRKSPGNGSSAHILNQETSSLRATPKSQRRGAANRAHIDSSPIGFRSLKSPSSVDVAVTPMGHDETQPLRCESMSAQIVSIGHDKTITTNL